MKKSDTRQKEPISSERLAAFLDGNLSATECAEILNALRHDATLQRVVEIAMTTPNEGSMSSDEQACPIPLATHTTHIPMEALAANAHRNLCVQKCEKVVLERLDVDCSEEDIVALAEQHHWLHNGGTPLHHIGRTLEHKGLTVSRLYECNLDDLQEALHSGDGVIVVVDGKELYKPLEENRYEDYLRGFEPNHAVVVLAYNSWEGSITLYDPSITPSTLTVEATTFVEAWEDSRYYMVTTNRKDMKHYSPKPINVEGVELNAELLELKEAIAENAHDIWAARRMEEGWKYGPERNDTARETPCMVHYSALPEEEKEYDRIMAMQTLKLMLKLGYDIVKREDTELYRHLMRQLRNKPESYHCSKCGALYLKHYIFCPQCGKELK